MSVLIQPKHLLEIAIEPKFKANHEEMMSALHMLAGEDPSFHVEVDPESGQVIIKAISELQVDTKVDMLRRRHKIDVNIGAPQVVYRETITKRTEIDYSHKKQVGGAGQFARVKLVVEPGAGNSGLVFESRIVCGAVPEEYLPGVERGVHSAMMSGNIIGYPMADMKVTLTDGAYHVADSTEVAFEVAARAAIREAITKASPVLLDPIMMIEVVSPEGYLGSVIGDLNFRRGQIAGTTSRGNAKVVSATVPLANMFGYVNDLRSTSQGRATYTMAFDHYEAVERAPNSPDPDDAAPTAMALRA